MDAMVYRNGEGEIYGSGPYQLRFLAQAPDRAIAITDNTVPPGFPGPVLEGRGRPAMSRP